MGQGMSLETLTRGKMADLTGCNSETIRYYERIGLLPKPKRGDNGYGHYGEDEVSRLRFISKAKQLGFSNNEVRELLSISNGADSHTRAEVKALTKNHIESIKHRIRELKKIEKSLTGVFTQCDGANERADHCPILMSLFDQPLQRD